MDKESPNIYYTYALQSKSNYINWTSTKQHTTPVETHFVPRRDAQTCVLHDISTASTIWGTQFRSSRTGHGVQLDRLGTKYFTVASRNLHGWNSKQTMYWRASGGSPFCLRANQYQQNWALNYPIELTSRFSGLYHSHDNPPTPRLVNVKAIKPMQIKTQTQQFA